MQRSGQRQLAAARTGRTATANLIDIALRYNLCSGRVYVTTGTRDSRPVFSVAMSWANSGLLRQGKEARRPLPARDPDDVRARLAGDRRRDDIARLPGVAGIRSPVLVAGPERGLAAGGLCPALARNRIITASPMAMHCWYACPSMTSARIHAILCLPAHLAGQHLCWSAWRRRHQARASRRPPSSAARPRSLLKPIAGEAGRVTQRPVDQVAERSCRRERRAPIHPCPDRC
jgi:hypothetical protein